MSELRSRRYSGPSFPEVELPKGDVTEGVVRVGDTVRRPHQEQSWAVAAYLDHLERSSFDASPRFLGLDDSGRDVLTFIDGDVCGAEIVPRFRNDELLASVGRLVRRLHTASEEYRPDAEPFPVVPPSPEEPELITHLDVTPQNVIVHGNEAIGLVDFDLAGPATRLRDSYNTAMHWVPLVAPEDLWEGFVFEDQLRRIRVFADAYGWTPGERERVPRYGAEAAARSYLLMRERATRIGGGWKRMWDNGVGELIHRRERWLLKAADAISEALRSG
jgi:hypothetical protein